MAEVKGLNKMAETSCGFNGRAMIDGQAVSAPVTISVTLPPRESVGNIIQMISGRGKGKLYRVTGVEPFKLHIAELKWWQRAAFHVCQAIRRFRRAA